MKRILFTAMIISCVLAARPSDAAIIRIPDDEANLSAALAAAEPADTILIEDEVYEGEDNTNLTIESQVTIMSVNGPDNCIFDAGGDDNIWVTIEAECNIIGLVILNAEIVISSTNIDNINIENCIITQSSSNGIMLTACNQFIIKDCLIFENDQNMGNSGAGVRISGSEGIITGCDFNSNTCLVSGGGLYLSGSEVIIDNCVFSNNTASNYGGGIYMTDMQSCLIKDSQIIGNRVDNNNGGGICITGNSEATLQTCIIEDNETTRSGGGFYISGGSIVNLFDSIIAENNATRSGAGIFVYNLSELNLFNSLFTENQAGIDGGGLAVTNNSIGDVINCDFVSNESGTGNGVDRGMGGGFYFGSGTVSMVLNCIFYDNAADIGEQMYTQNANDIDIRYTCIQDGVNPDDDWEFDNLIDEDNIDDDPLLTEGTDPVWGRNGFYLEEESPCIDAGSESAVRLGLDTLTTQVNFAFDDGVVDMGFHYSVRWFDLRGRLFGTVVRAENDDPLQNVHIVTSYGQEAVTDEEGAWEIPAAMAFPFTITASLPGYNSLTLNDQELELDGESEINFALLHPEFTPSIQRVSEELDIADEEIVEFEIANTGDGPLVWTSQIKFPDEDDLQPWDLRISGDPIAGLRAAIIVDQLYILAIDIGGESIISVRNGFGDILYDFDQPGGGIGMSDLSWDGELIWGARGRDVYGFTLEGELITNFRAARNPSIALTWDSDLEYIWVVGVNSDIFGYDLEGNLRQTIQNPNMLTYRGLAYFTDDLDGYNLYMLNDLGENDPRTGVRKINTENGAALLEAVLEPEAGEHVRGGFFTNEIIAGSTVFLGVTDVDDDARLDVWYVNLIRSWISMEPIEGTIEPGEEDNLRLSLITSNFIEGLYEANIVFSHNALGGEAVIPVRMEVVVEPFITTRTIALKVGWNLMSANLQPEDADFRVITENLVAANRLVAIKDQHGHFYRPEEDFYNMEGWSVEQGYWILVNLRSRLDVTGMTVRSNDPIELQEGWQIVAYYPRNGMNPALAFSGIAGNLTIAKDGDGAFYIPEFNFSSINICRFGSGYMLKMTDEDELIWGMNNEDELAMALPASSISAPQFYSKLEVTGSDMSLLLLIEDSKMSGEIGVFANGSLVGSGVIFNQQCGIAIRGSEPIGGFLSGANEEDELVVSWWNGSIESSDLKIEKIRGGLVYQTDGLTVAKVSSSLTPATFSLKPIYPNPFNSSIRISFSTPEGGHVSLLLFDLLGREVARLIDNEVAAGSREVTFNAATLSTGVYFVRLANRGNVNIQKITCLK